MRSLIKIFAGAIFTITLSAAPAVAETVLTYGEPGPNRGSRAAATRWFAEQVETRSNGDLKINIMWGGALFKANAARQSVAAGVVDIGTIIPDYFLKEMVAFSLTNLPFENLDPWVGLKANYEHMQTPVVTQHLAKQNLVFVTSYMLSNVILLCNGDGVRTLEDIKGKKVRGIGTFGKVFSDFGANLVSMSIYQAYQGLDNGLIDCSLGYLNASLALKQHEVSNSLTKLNWGTYTGLGMFINKDALARLSPSQRQVLKEVGADFIDYLGQDVMKSDLKAEQKFTQGIDGHQLEIINLSPTDNAKLYGASQIYIQKWQTEAQKSGFDGKALLENYQQALTKYTQERDEIGYPWQR
ncbi:C4-dicarboxylate TRAP transporter substrate-binding protein [uncultured Paraglaciecola sp.]|uniref:C4-dicarboxylate TRAP transporter substrate-binding protein n=1 Tax=uncultured Paraglaciecola sp. TaxID=1765024 RepID=UPI0026346955|nr:C4-dicarboxylate TRAP transporter substrate-binding protein [uncultured Paraglaciecola sp.]